MIALITGSLLKIMINWVIISIPAVNIYGAPIGTLLGYCCMAVMDYVFIRRELKQNPDLLKAFGKPFLCSILMGAAACGVYYLTEFVFRSGGKLGMAAGMLISIVVAVVIYAALIIKTRCITNEDMKLIPGGERVGKLLHMQ